MSPAEKVEAAREQGYCEALSLATVLVGQNAPPFTVGHAVAGVLAQFGCRPHEVFEDVRSAYRFAVMEGRRA